MILAGALLALAAVCILGGPLVLGLRPWGARRPQLALGCWLAVFLLGLGALAGSVAASVAQGVRADVLDPRTVSGTAVAVAAWTALALLGGAASLVLTRAEPIAETRATTAGGLDLLIATAAVRTERMHGVCVVTVQCDEPIACVVPGGGRLVVVTTALTEALGPAALRAVIEHERAHLVHRHGLLLGVAALQRACVPAFFGARALERAVHLLVEFIADDAAVRVCGHAAVCEAVTAVDRLRPNEGARLRAARIAAAAARSGAAAVPRAVAGLPKARGEQEA